MLIQIGHQPHSMVLLWFLVSFSGKMAPLLVVMLKYNPLLTLIQFVGNCFHVNKPLLNKNCYFRLFIWCDYHFGIMYFQVLSILPSEIMTYSIYLHTKQQNYCNNTFQSFSNTYHLLASKLLFYKVKKSMS